MTVVDLKTHPIAHWKQEIVDSYSFLPYWWIRGVSTDSRKALMRQDLEGALTAEKTYLLGYISDRGDLLGFAQMHWLEWDTNHFGVEIWRLDHMGMWESSSQGWIIADALVKGIIQVAREQGCRCIQARIPVDNLKAVHALESNGFRMMEILTVWLFDFARASIPPKKHPDMVRDFEPADCESLVELARTVYASTPGRFHMDPHLPSRTSDELYADWMRNSCSGELADHISVAASDGKVVGCSTLEFCGDHEGLCNARIAKLGLGAMSPSFRNRGLVTDVVIHHLEWLNERQADFCSVGTQGNNIPPQRVWLKIGFKPAVMALTLHHWADE